MSVRALLLAAMLGAVMGDVDYALLRDVPMASGTLQYLDSNESTWTVYDSLNRWTLPGMIPGDLISDLQAANIIPDPNFGLTFLESSLWDGCSLTYQTQFLLSPAMAASVSSGTSEVLLVFDSLKLVADISLNVS